MKIVLVFLFLLSFSSYAHISKYTGVDPKTKSVCTLEIEHEFYENGVEDKSSYRVEVVTSFEGFEDDHDHEHEAEPVTMKFMPSNGKSLYGISDDGDVQLAVVLKNEFDKLVDPSFFNIKRKHGNHYHIDSCKDLTLE